MKKTIKLPIINLSENDRLLILRYQKNQNNLIRYTYNRLRENDELKTAEITALQKTMRNIFVDSHFKNSATYKANSLLRDDNSKVIFGGKTLFLQRCQNKISKEAFQLQKLVPLISIGESPQKGNRKFEILSHTEILFKPCKKDHLILHLPFLKPNLKKELMKLKECQNQKILPITYELTTQFIYIMYDDDKINAIQNYHVKKNRIIAIDLNPNYIGYSVMDWQLDGSYMLIHHGLFDLTHFSQKSKELKKVKWELKKLGTSGEDRKQIILKKLIHLNAQRNHETIAIAIRLFNIFRGYNCQVFGMEDLTIKSEDKKKGKRFNRLTNNEWLRNNLINQLQKRMDRIGTSLIKVLPQYSSILGNILYRNLNLPDPILSSVEINRRTFEFYNQYITKTKPKTKIIVQPKWETSQRVVAQSLEELGYHLGKIHNWAGLYGVLQKAKVKYRLSLEAVQNSREFSECCIKNKVKLYNFT